jgi:DNA-binding NtrC family response regulator
MRVARRGMEALARSLSPPSWWLRSNPSTVPAAQAAELPERVETPSSLRESKLLVERELLQQALRNSRGNKTEAARRLQLSRQGLYRKLRRHGLHPGTKEPGEGRQSRGRRL